MLNNSLDIVSLMSYLRVTLSPFEKLMGVYRTVLPAGMKITLLKDKSRFGYQTSGFLIRVVKFRFMILMMINLFLDQSTLAEIKQVKNLIEYKYNMKK